MKITNTQLQQIIKEEAKRLKTRMMLENEKTSILKKLQEIEECDMMEEESLEEDAMDWFQKMSTALTKGFKLDGQYLPKSKNKNNVASYRPALLRLKQFVPELSDAQAQEAIAILLDTNKMGTFVGGSIFPTFDPATSTIKFASKAAMPNPNVVGVAPVATPATTPVATTPTAPTK